MSDMSDMSDMSAVYEAGAAKAPATMSVPFDPARLMRGLGPIAVKRQFCLWRLEANLERPDKPRKVPYLLNGRRLTGSYSDPELRTSLLTLTEGVQRVQAGGYDGVGLVFTPDCGVLGVDWDHVVTPDGKVSLNPAQRAAWALLKGRAFVEVSVSGTGLHAVALGVAPTMKANGVLEVFGDKNFLALTGARGGGTVRAIGVDDTGRLLDAVRNAQADGKRGAVDRGAQPPSIDSRRTPALDVNGEVSGTRSNGREAPARVRSALFHLSADCDYAAWIGLAFAVRDALGDGGLALFDEWSQTAPDRYNAQAVHLAWNSDSTPAGGIGAGTLFKKALDGGWQEPARSVAPAADIAIDQTEAEAQAAEAAADIPQPTDVWVARQFVRLFCAGFRYDHGVQRWVAHREGSWKHCRKGEEVEAFKQLSGRLMQEAGKMQAGDAQTNSQSGTTKKLLACAMRAQSAPGVEAALKLARSDPAIAASPDEFDCDPDLFNAANGVIHLPSGELLPHAPSQMLSRQSPVPYDASAACPAWHRFLEQVSCERADLVNYLKRVCGYTLSGRVGAEKMFFMLGRGANGKSVMANVVRYIFGSYAVVAPSAFLMLSRRDGGGPTPELAMIAGARLVLANEVEAGSRLSGQMVKVAVSTEAITARHLHANPFTFRPTHKLWIRGNHRPIINDDDEGIWRRIDLVPFERNFAPEERDDGLEARLLEEAPGILAWMVEGHRMWRCDGLRPARCVDEASRAYRRDSDLLAQWIEDACEVGASYAAPQRQAYQHYQGWCREQGLGQYSKKSFTRGLVERGFGEKREGAGSRQEVYTGLRLRV
ncbi:MAG: PriCT-2 domain-containing protein [Methylibium sp.]|nr:PriCT-2 domain-containing protein [Methylibium sp.]MBA3623483.1 PriCT-2 domain-containing protein [Methylibium sp.]